MTTTLELHVRKIQWFCQQDEGFCMHIFSSYFMIFKRRNYSCHSWSFVLTRGHSWSLVVTRGHSWSLVVIRGHSCVLLDKII